MSCLRSTAPDKLLQTDSAARTMPIGVEDYTAARNRAPKAAERAPAHYRTWASFDPWKDNPGCTIRVAKRPSCLVKPPFAAGHGDRHGIEVSRPEGGRRGGRTATTARPPQWRRRRRASRRCRCRRPTPTTPPLLGRRVARGLGAADARDAAAAAVARTAAAPADVRRRLAHVERRDELAAAAVARARRAAAAVARAAARRAGRRPYCDSSTQTLTRDEGVLLRALDAPAAAAAARPPPPPTAAEVPLRLRNIEAFSGGRVRRRSRREETRPATPPRRVVRPPSAPSDGWAATRRRPGRRRRRRRRRQRRGGVRRRGGGGRRASWRSAADVAAAGADVPTVLVVLSQLEQLDYLLPTRRLQRLREPVAKVRRARPPPPPPPRARRTPDGRGRPPSPARPGARREGAAARGVARVDWLAAADAAQLARATTSSPRRSRRRPAASRRPTAAPAAPRSRPPPNSSPTRSSSAARAAATAIAQYPYVSLIGGRRPQTSSPPPAPMAHTPPRALGPRATAAAWAAAWSTRRRQRARRSSRSRSSSRSSRRSTSSSSRRASSRPSADGLVAAGGSAAARWRGRGRLGRRCLRVEGARRNRPAILAAYTGGQSYILTHGLGARLSPSRGRAEDPLALSPSHPLTLAGQ